MTDAQRCEFCYEERSGQFTVLNINDTGSHESIWRICPECWDRVRSAIVGCMMHEQSFKDWYIERLKA